MTIWEILLLGVGLSMDAIAVSITNALCMPRIRAGGVLRVAGAFGVFQGIMPILGYYAASLFADLIRDVDHWIALILLLFLGGKMIVEAVRAAKEPTDCAVVLSTRTLLLQALATSIDALAVGISFAMLSVNVYLASGTIALTTFALCVLAMLLARFVGEKLGRRAGIVGGVILIAIGIKIFLEHTVFS